jgi:hypothetical protein
MKRATVEDGTSVDQPQVRRKRPRWQNDTLKPTAAEEHVEPTAYQVLGLDPWATRADAKAAFLRLALRSHPDKGGSAETFIRIQDAYQEICSNGISCAFPKRNAQTMKQAVVLRSSLMDVNPICWAEQLQTVPIPVQQSLFTLLQQPSLDSSKERFKKQQRHKSPCPTNIRGLLGKRDGYAIRLAWHYFVIESEPALTLEAALGIKAEMTEYIGIADQKWLDGADVAAAMQAAFSLPLVHLKFNFDRVFEDGTHVSSPSTSDLATVLIFQQELLMQPDVETARQKREELQESIRTTRSLAKASAFKLLPTLLAAAAFSVKKFMEDSKLRRRLNGKQAVPVVFDVEQQGQPAVTRRINGKQPPPSLPFPESDRRRLTFKQPDPQRVAVVPVERTKTSRVSCSIQ